MSTPHKNQLFRSEVFEKVNRTAEGVISIAEAKYNRTIFIVSLLILIPMLAYITIGNYTRRTTISGLLVPTNGAIKIVPSPPGIVTNIHAREGEHVVKGQPLFTINDERRISTAGSQNRLDDSLQTNRDDRKEKIKDLIRITGRSLKTNQEEFSRKIVALRIQKEMIFEEQQILLRRISSAKETVNQIKTLTERKYFTDEAAREKEDVVEALNSQLLSSKRQSIEIQRAIIQADKDLSDSHFRVHTQISELNGKLALIDRENIEDDVRTKYTITAPEDGVITASTVDLGQYVGGKPIAVLLPEGAKFEVRLYASPREIAFIKPGQKVKLRYRAFPYQKFGQFDGIVANVALAPTDASELPLDQQKDQQDKYRVTVRPALQYVKTSVAEIPLLAGMTADANIFQEEKRIIEWIVDPLKSINHTL